VFCSKDILTKTVFAAGLVCVLSLHPANLLADTLTWTIADNTFMRGGGAVSGSLGYDADAVSNPYSNVSIAVATDNGVPGETYITSEIIGESSTFLDLLDSVTQSEVQLYFLNPLTDAGGTDPMGIHLLSGGNPNPVDYEAGNGGYNALIATPEPQSALMLLLGILCVSAAKGWSSFRSARRLSRVKA
jgi:hypothetical protein